MASHILMIHCERCWRILGSPYVKILKLAYEIHLKFCEFRKESAHGKS